MKSSTMFFLFLMLSVLIICFTMAEKLKSIFDMV